jgi:hypothetical protein
VPAPRRPDELLHGPFTTAEAAAVGLTRSQLRSACWRRLLHEVHCSAALPDSIGLRVAAIAKLLPPSAVVSGTAAAWVHGVDVRRPLDEPITVTYPRTNGISSRREVVIRHAQLPSTDITQLGGIPVTTPLRTAFDLARRRNLIEGVVALDALLNARLVALDELREYVAAHRAWRGVRSAAKAVTLAEPRSESPMESRLRMVIVLPGLPRPEAQVALCRPGGQEVARIDLGYRDARKGYEFDGAEHEVRWEADRRRRNDIWFDFGWELRNYGGADVYRRPQVIVAHVARGLGVRVPVIPPIMLEWLSPRRW